MEIMEICNKIFKTRGKLTLFNCLSILRRKSGGSCKMRDFDLPDRYQAQNKPSVWEEYGKLATDNNPKVNLGQGFPNFPPPTHLTDALAEVAVREEDLTHQYTRGPGHLRLVNVLAQLYSKLLCRELNPLTDFIITIGGYMALYLAIIGHVNEGEEVIIIEPFFDCYEPMVQAAGGCPKLIPLRFKPKSDDDYKGSDWKLNMKELRNLFNKRTKAIIINNPNNPTGKIFTQDELEEIACLCKEFDTICISDEVYEWITFGGLEHVRMASLPGMWDRTITVGSAGKTFGITGWKLGWTYGPSKLLHNLRIVHQNTCFTCSSPLQEALAMAFECELRRFGQDDCYLTNLACEMQVKKDYMCEFLKDAGFKPVNPDGGYFVIADFSSFESSIDLSGEKDKEKDYRFTKWMSKNVGIQCIPTTAFYGEKNKNLSENFIRLCYVKTDEKLKLADQILRKFKSTLKKK